MKTARNRVARFAKFLARFWPLWTICAIICIVPPSRTLARRHLVGSIYDSYSTPSLRTMWRGITGRWNEEIDNPLPAAKTHSRDLDLALWDNFWHSNGFNITGRTKSGAPDVNGLIVKFPGEIMALAPALQDELQIYQWRTGSYSNQTIDNKRLGVYAARAHALEPDNAAWIVAQVLSVSRAGDFAGTLKLLQSAAKCRYYDDKTLETARRVLNAHARYGALEDYEKRAIFDKIRAGNVSSWDTIRFWSNRAAYLRKSGKNQQALQWSAALAQIGALMQRDPNSLTTIYGGRLWQQRAWMMGVMPKRGNKLSSSERFARYAIQQGRTDLVATTRAQDKQARALAPLVSASDDDWNGSDSGLWLQADDLDGRLSFIEIGGFCLICASFYLLFWWLLANIFLWRATGVASSRAARGTLAAVVVALLLVAATASVWFFNFQTRGPNFPITQSKIARENLFGSLGVFAFVGAPFALALAVAAITMWRGRAQFELPPRVDTEMALPRWARALLRWFLPLGVIGTLLFLVGGWALWILAAWNNWTGVDLLAWLPPDRNGKTGSLSWDMQNNPSPMAYGIFMCLVCLITWFSKWRWASARALRPLTHGALRWWKESLGCALVALFCAYFIVALLGAPVNARANARLNRVLQGGELSVLRELKLGKKQA